MAGLKFTADTINGALGATAKDLTSVMARLQSLVYFMGSRTDDELIAVGVDEKDLPILRDAVSNMNELTKAFEGQGGTTYKSSISRLAGLGPLF